MPAEGHTCKTCCQHSTGLFCLMGSEFKGFSLEFLAQHSWQNIMVEVFHELGCKERASKGLGGGAPAVTHFIQGGPVLYLLPPPVPSCYFSLSFYFHDRVSLCSLDITLAQAVRKHTACPCLLSTWIKGMCHYRLALLFFIWGLIHRLGHNTQDVIRDKLRGPCCRQCASGHILTVQGVVVLAQ